MRKQYKYGDLICNQFDADVFRKQCKAIEERFPKIEKAPLVEDVDGSLYQLYHHENGDVYISNDYMGNYVYLESDFDLVPYFAINVD